MDKHSTGNKYRHWPGGHEVVVVEHLDEGLDLGPLGNLLLAHGCGHLTGVAVDACDQSVAVRTVGCAIINVLQETLKGLWHHHNKKKHGCAALTSFLQYYIHLIWIWWRVGARSCEKGSNSITDEHGSELTSTSPLCTRTYSEEPVYQQTHHWSDSLGSRQHVLPWRWQLCARRSVQLGPSPPSQASWTCPFLPQRKQGSTSVSLPHIQYFTSNITDVNLIKSITEILSNFLKFVSRCCCPIGQLS